MPVRRLALVALLLLASCGRTVPLDEGHVVTVRAPSLEPRAPAVATLEPPPPPTPKPTPAPTIAPTPSGPLDPPAGASLRAAAGLQQGTLATQFCWNHGDGRTSCRDPQAPAAARIGIRRGETVTVRIDVKRKPSREWIRPFQGARDGYPTTRVDAALESPLEIALDAGEWELDVCAEWLGYAPQVCWQFRMLVTGAAPSPEPVPATPGPTAAATQTPTETAPDP